MVAVTAEVLAPSPGPRAGITITDLGVGTSVFTVWQVADGIRNPLPAYRRVTATDSTFITDYYVPTNRPVTYEIEVLSGPGGASRVTSAAITVPSATGWLMDPLIPQSAIPVVGERRTDGDIYLRSQALSSLEYEGDVSMFKIMGSDRPMALFGQRMAETGMDISVGLRSAEENAKLKRLLRSTTSLHFRPLLDWGAIELEGSMFLASAKVRQTPVNVLMGGKLTWWDLPTDTVQGPAIKVLTATFTYGDVDILMTTYQQKLDSVIAAAAAAGEAPTYLFDLKKPIG
jgi:hypothetical protein